MGQPIEYIPDFSEANRDLDELVGLSLRSRFDLFEFLRLLSEAGAPTLCCEVDNGPASSTGCRVVRYQLGEGPKVLLTALGAKDLDSDEIGCGSSRGSALAPVASPRQSSHDPTSIPIADNQQ